MKTSPRFYRPLFVAIVAGALAVYYLIPGITHFRPMGPTTDPAIPMAVICCAVALIAGVIAAMRRPRRTQE
jgi:peptidoglycan/LPS O-acetylase OafA/YrhL